MTTLRAVDEATAQTLKPRARVSEVIITEFLEQDNAVMEVATDEETKVPTLYTTLKMYTRNHPVPVRVFMRQGKIYLERTTAEAPKANN